VSKSELPGTYSAYYGFATEKLTLKENGEFTQEIKVKANGKIAVTNGTWRFDPEDRYIVFSESFMVVANGFGEMVPDFDSPKPGIVIEPVRRFLGKLQLGVSPGFIYKKNRP
jgi:hypothetical protein